MSCGRVTLSAVLVPSSLQWVYMYLRLMMTTIFYLLCITAS